MVQDLNGGDGKDASFYSGLLVSAYAVAEAITAMGWGSLSDHYGRKPVVLIGLGGVALSCLILGFAQNYWVALMARFVGGALNGNVSVMQTMVAEMVKVPEHERESTFARREHERRVGRARLTPANSCGICDSALRVDIGRNHWICSGRLACKAC
jgi:MFS family permease